MNLLVSKLWIPILLAILVLGFFLRSNNLYTWPRLGATFDEYAWTWQGISLIQNKVPTSWSYHPQYKQRKEIRFQTVPFILVTPYLEHPPLFGLVAGGYALLNGAHNMMDISIHKIRGLALFLGLLSTFAVFLLASKLYGRGVGLLSSLLYATVPTIVIGSRLVQNENFFIPMWLFSLYFAASYIKNKKRWMRNTAALLAGLLILAKVPWAAAPFSLCAIYLYHKRYKDMVITAAIALLMLVVYFIYGFYYDKTVFLGLWGLQLNRYDISFGSIFTLFQKPYLADRFFLDGWIFWGWIAFIILLVRDFKKNVILFTAVLSYFLVFIVAIPDEAGHGWYRYPFYPFLVISIALFIKEYFGKNLLLTFFFIVFVGTSLFEVTWKTVLGFSYPIFRLMIISWGITLIPQYLPCKKMKNVSSIITYIWFIVLILLSTWAVLLYNEQ